MISYLREIALTAGMYALVVLATLATLEFLGLRQPIRDGLATVRTWAIDWIDEVLLVAVPAFIREVRDFWRWVANPGDPWFTSGTQVNAEDIDSVEFVVWPDEPTAQTVDEARARLAGFRSAFSRLTPQKRAEIIKTETARSEGKSSRPRRKRRPKK